MQRIYRWFQKRAIERQSRAMGLNIVNTLLRTTTPNGQAAIAVLARHTDNGVTITWGVVQGPVTFKQGPVSFTSN